MRDISIWGFLLTQMIWAAPLLLCMAWLIIETRRRHWLGLALGLAALASVTICVAVFSTENARMNRFYQMMIVRNTLAILDAGKTDEVRALLGRHVSPSMSVDQTPASRDFTAWRHGLITDLTEMREAVQPPLSPPVDNTKSPL